MLSFLETTIKTLLILLPILISVAFLTLLERKIMAAVQQRVGPDVVGFFGLLQPFADGLKLLLKETIIPTKANKFLFIMAPIVTIFLSFISWAIIPFNFQVVFFDLSLGLLYIFAVSSIGVYGVIISGWASNSRYAFLGTLRSAAQMISYEVSIGFIVMHVILFANSLNLDKIIWAQEYIWYCLPLFPVFCLFFLSAIAETNRPPFDLPEAEAELVAGYFVEYSSMSFAQFFLGENINIILMCTLLVIFFGGGYLIYPMPAELQFSFHNLVISFFFSAKILFFLFSFVWVRTTFPRYRYDQLMRLGWKVFLPLILGFIILFGSLALVFQLLI